jgi:membrane protein implicated in regulation of membrane protease activity
MLGALFLVAAVVGGTILVCQFALTLIGMGHDGTDIAHHAGGDFHGDHAGDWSSNGDSQHPDSSHLFGVISFRTLVAAAAFFGVSGRAALSADYAGSTALILAVVIGIGAMYGMYWLMRLIASLNSAGNERISNAVGRQGTVYIPIPASRLGAGKVQLSMQNRIVEYLAVTDDAEPLKTGETVEVIGVAGGDTLTVRRSAVPMHTEPATC